MKFAAIALLISTLVAQFETCKDTNLPSVKDCTQVGSYFQGKKYTAQVQKQGKVRNVKFSVKGDLLNPIYKGSWSVSNSQEGINNFKVFDICEFNECPLLLGEGKELKLNYSFVNAGESKESLVHIRLVSPQSFIYLNDVKLTIKN
ncbi:hypothetical protein CONCODRAFT_3293 [Conidiobolus coronatus NRRL 28638]|uniref:MD-2-related lipid-recognition domain-containing protein n=1 Tax=Conidiobolus coronatus (strain ATCC 28846 / CBS 209.66 / NRRL 28638) TaxID=796925 RepID=A0A137PFF6_CONC2|nr:hypothetical protein CONCODRAFT_3293 [Conidiobolus coronatus NRRL 28638]|eukprot:KXN73733.1 hypothetical protein CONCODRAFT_3293 [Conidiobolus coronatus NRRL 28638]